MPPSGSGPRTAPGSTSTPASWTAPHDAGIEPAVTLHHRDLPQAGEERGGRRDREVARGAAERADKVSPCVCTKSVSAYREGGSGPPSCWV
ncbi:family 1 glycosylhydrolase [Streptomyces fradiae]|uniref:family 1 glycosylhydrolase n=1 Tax=Streptomyces fradiae TaxID=1906 RepID=UPI00366A1B1B